MNFVNHVDKKINFKSSCLHAGTEVKMILNRKGVDDSEVEDEDDEDDEDSEDDEKGGTLKPNLANVMEVGK